MATHAVYPLDNALPQAEPRFEVLAQAYDPNTIRRFEALGVAPGWECLEVGGGGGSIASWIAERVGPSGRVVVTDIDPRHLQQLRALGLGNVDVQQHDVVADPLPEGAFDLVHERLVLNHLPARREALAKMVRALKPGGWIVVEAAHGSPDPRSLPDDDSRAAGLFDKAAAALYEVFASFGNHPSWGRELFGELRANGLADVGAVGELQVCPAGSPGLRLDRINFEQLADRMVETGTITRAELDELFEAMDEPGFAAFSSSTLWTAWGRRPAT